ncbi:hypothetical protein JNL27_16525 [bacterium]|nr:hypothetical protein [bacterium]
MESKPCLQLIASAEAELTETYKDMPREFKDTWQFMIQHMRYLEAKGNYASCWQTYHDHIVPIKRAVVMQEMERKQLKLI